MSQPLRVLTREQTSETERVLSHNLPLQPTPFIGREQDTAVASALLENPDVRLLTLVGPPGIGKTRLAIQIAAGLLRNFPDGVFFISLASIIDPSLVTPTIAHVLQVGEAGGQILLEAVKHHLHGRRVLLLLDNFEQVVEEAPVIAELLAHCPQLKVLATSREILDLRGEYRFEVPPLALPDIKDNKGRLDTDAIQEREAIALFVQRAQLVRSDFRISPANANVVAEICIRLDGIPLAIELAAARMKVLSPEDTLARLSRRLELLSGGPRDSPERHKTLRNAIEWSYDLLDETEQTVFRRISVFVGGCTLRAVEAMCNTEGDPHVDAFQAVTSLVDKSLLRQQAGPGGETRFWMLETIREYARDKLEQSVEAERLQSWHAGYFLGLAESAWRHFFEETGQPQWGEQDVEWVNRLEADFGNMRAALNWFLEQSVAKSGTSALQYVEKGLRLAAALLRLWFVRGYFTEGLHYVRSFISKVPTPALRERRELRASYEAALNTTGWLALMQGDIAAARQPFEASLEIATELQDRARMALALHGLGVLATGNGDYATARLRQTESLLLFRELGHKWGSAVSLQHLGEINVYEGNFNEGYLLLEKSSILFRQIGDKFGLASALENTAFAAYYQGDSATAQRLWRETLTLGREIGFKSVVCQALVGLGWTALRDPDHDQAAASLGEALALSNELGDIDIIYLSLTGIGALATRRHMVEQATRLFAAAEKVREANNIQLAPVRQTEVETDIATTRVQMSPQNWDKAWAEGYSLPSEQVVPFALQVLTALSEAIRPSTDLARTRNPAPAPTPPYPDGLTAREVEVLSLLAAGLSNSEIAERLYLSRRTIHAHLRSIYDKTQAHNRQAATRYAIEHKFVP